MNSCIRDSADLQQLNRCKSIIDKKETTLYEIAEILNLAGNSVRFKILYLLHKEKEMCPCDLSDVLSMTVPAISQHLKKLKGGNLLNQRQEKQTIYYSLNNSKTELLNKIFNKIDNE